MRGSRRHQLKIGCRSETCSCGSPGLSPDRCSQSGSCRATQGQVSILLPRSDASARAGWYLRRRAEREEYNAPCPLPTTISPQPQPVHATPHSTYARSRRHPLARLLRARRPRDAAPAAYQLAPHPAKLVRQAPAASGRVRPRPRVPQPDHAPPSALPDGQHGDPAARRLLGRARERARAAQARHGRAQPRGARRKHKNRIRRPPSFVTYAHIPRVHLALDSHDSLSAIVASDPLSNPMQCAQVPLSRCFPLTRASPAQHHQYLHQRSSAELLRRATVQHRPPVWQHPQCQDIHSRNL